LKGEKDQQTTGPITLFSPPGGPVSGEYLTQSFRAFSKNQVSKSSFIIASLHSNRIFERELLRQREKKGGISEASKTGWNRPT